MLRYIIILSVTLLAHAFNHQDIVAQIYGGEHTEISKYTYQVLLLSNNEYNKPICGGSILNKNWVMTAAHCLEGKSSVRVLIGTTKIWLGGTKYTSNKLIIHPKYDSDTVDYDIGLIDLRDTPMTLDGITAKSTILPEEGDSLPVGTKVTITGWGATDEFTPISYTLQDVQVTIVNQTVCNEIYHNKITPRMVCAGIPQGGKDSCQGDSGGPMVKSDDLTQVGIVSFGDGCGRPGIPGVYTRVSAVRKWIKDITGI